MMIRWLVATLLLLATTPARAALPPSPAPVSVIGGTTTLTASSVTGSVVLSQPVTAYPAVQVRNTGSVTAWVASGTSSVTATLSSIPVLPGDSVTLWVSVAANTYVAAITSSSTATLQIYQWNGLPTATFGANANGVAGAVNQGTSPWVVGGVATGVPIPTIPSITTFQGAITLSANTSTTLTSGNVTINAAGAALPATFQKLTIINTGSNPATVCWFGSTCSAALGSETLAAGASDTVNLNGFATPPTLFSTLGTTLSFRN